MQKPKNYAFIDGQNVNLAIRDLGWRLDMRRFRVYLADKYDVTIAYYFIGYVEGNDDLYASLQKSGFTLVFKPTLKNKYGIVKGNCDAELVLQAMIDIDRYEEAIIATGDGDFYCLVKYLKKQGKLRAVMVPNMYKYSALLKKVDGSHLVFMNCLRKKLEFKRSVK